MVIYVNAAGCTNTCRHCSASGRPPHRGFYSLAELRRLAQEWGPVWPYFEATAHPEFPEIIGPDVIGSGGTCLPTTGYGLAQREDYRELFVRMREVGCSGVSFTLHGLEGNHDWFTGRTGAFRTIIEASRRATESGFRIHWNVFPDQHNIGDVAELVELGHSEFSLGSLSLEIAAHRVSRRSWCYENIRPDLDGVARLLQKLDSGKWQAWFKDLALQDFTESALLQVWKTDPHSERLLSPWEPRTWLPVLPSDNIVIYMDENRQVFLDPMCGELIPLGALSDGKDEILKRLEQIAIPPYASVSPAQAQLPKPYSNLLHPGAESLRMKVISDMLFGACLEI